MIKIQLNKLLHSNLIKVGKVVTSIVLIDSFSMQEYLVLQNNSYIPIKEKSLVIKLSGAITC